MLDRFIVAAGVVIVGVMAYRLLLLVQRRLVAQRIQSDEMSGHAALLVFTSPTCAPCKLQQLPIVNRLMTEWNDKIDVRVIDVAEEPEVAQQYGVWSLPTTIVLQADHSVVAINQGVAQAKKLREQFERATSNQRVGESANQPVGMLAAD